MYFEWIFCHARFCEIILCLYREFTEAHRSSWCWHISLYNIKNIITNLMRKVCRYWKLWRSLCEHRFSKIGILLNNLNLFTCNKCSQYFLWRDRLTSLIFEKISARYRYICLDNKNLSSCYLFKKKQCSWKKQPVQLKQLYFCCCLCFFVYVEQKCAVCIL